MARDDYHGLEAKRSSDALSLKRGKPFPPCDKCEKPNAQAAVSNYCEPCATVFKARIRRDPETQPVGAPYGDDLNTPTDPAHAEAVWKAITVRNVVVCPYCHSAPLEVYGIAAGDRVYIPIHVNEHGFECRSVRNGTKAIVEREEVKVKG